MFAESPETRTWKFAGTTWQLGQSPKIMGIVNVTPDSFSDGGQWSSCESAVEHALQLAAEGADILDIGGESTRPFSEPVSPDEELRRVIPVIQQLVQRTNVPISIDTMKSQVAKAALSAGAVIVNDVSGMTFDRQMIDVCKNSDCGMIVMHMQGTPQTMQIAPTYADVVVDLVNFFENRVEVFAAAGIDPLRVMFDPGLGFGKTADHNLQLLRDVAAFRVSGRPVLYGHSRKGFLKKIIGREVDERLAGTIGVSIALAQQHADVLRVHDVAAVRDAISAWSAITGVCSTSNPSDEAK